MDQMLACRLTSPRISAKYSFQIDILSIIFIKKWKESIIKLGKVNRISFCIYACVCGGEAYKNFAYHHSNF